MISVVPLSHLMLSELEEADGSTIFLLLNSCVIVEYQDSKTYENSMCTLNLIVYPRL